MTKEELEKDKAYAEEQLDEQIQATLKLQKENKDQINQLTKAKEIIKDLLNLPFANNEEVYADVTSHLDRAEQFLKEIEKCQSQKQH